MQSQREAFTQAECPGAELGRGLQATLGLIFQYCDPSWLQWRYQREVLPWVQVRFAGFYCKNCMQAVNMTSALKSQRCRLAGSMALAGEKGMTWKRCATCVSLPICNHTHPASPDWTLSCFPKPHLPDSSAGGLPSFWLAGPARWRPLIADTPSQVLLLLGRPSELIINKLGRWAS